MPKTPSASAPTFSSFRGLFPTRFGAVALACCMVLATAACSKNKSKSGNKQASSADASQVVAKVDDSVITVGDVQERINKQSPFVRARSARPSARRSSWTASSASRCWRTKRSGAVTTKTRRSSG